MWCLQRHRNGGLNSGQKSAIIVTDALLVEPIFIEIKSVNLHVNLKGYNKRKDESMEK